MGEPRKGSVGLGSLLAQGQTYFMIAPDVQISKEEKRLPWPSQIVSSQCKADPWKHLRD